MLVTVTGTGPKLPDAFVVNEPMSLHSSAPSPGLNLHSSRVPGWLAAKPVPLTLTFADTGRLELGVTVSVAAEACCAEVKRSAMTAMPARPDRCLRPKDLTDALPPSTATTRPIQLGTVAGVVTWRTVGARQTVLNLLGDGRLRPRPVFDRSAAGRNGTHSPSAPLQMQEDWLPSTSATSAISSGACPARLSTRFASADWTTTGSFELAFERELEARWRQKVEDLPGS